MPALIERPKMSRAMWDALKNHISKERQRKKQEQEADAAIERMRRERENKQKQDVMTLEETKEQIGQLEQRLSQLKDEKHQLFLQLKKVLNEDEIRRRAVPKETNDMLTFGHGYAPPSVQLGRHPVFLQTNIPGRNNLYKIGMPSHLASGSLKRPRSPSPPNYITAYNYKGPSVSSHNQKGSYSTSATASYYHHHSSSQTLSTSTPTFSTQPVFSYSAHSTYPPGSVSAAAQQSPSANVEPKHVPHSYHVQHLPAQSYGPPLSSQLEQSAHKSAYADELYFGVQGSIPIRTSSGVHHGQTLVLAPQQTKPGGITSGYPVRGQGTSVSSGNFQSPASQQHQSAYVGPRHSFPNQGQSAGRYY